MSSPEVDALLDELRPRAFAIAYRMLGSVSEAEDIVQEGLIRLHDAIDGGEEIASPQAYLATVVTRLGIDELRSARARRETYVGEWLPEPVVTGGAGDPAGQAEMADSLSLAFLVVLETLSPEQRAVFLLREVFDYPYEQIAGIVGKSEVATRQIATRARRQIDAERPRFEASRAERAELAERFMAAAREGDLAALEQLLAADVELHGDGGGKAPALARPLHGRSSVAKAVTNWMRLTGRVEGLSIEMDEVNGQPGAKVLDPEGRLLGVMGLDIAEGQVQSIRSVVNPDKLQHLGPVGDAATTFRELRER